MACFKTLSLSGGCVLETCETKDAYMFGADPELYQEDTAIAYSSDHCYCVMIYYNSAFTNSYIGKYDPATNTLIQKADLGTLNPTDIAYDATAEKFVMNDTSMGDIITYDPVSETFDTFNPGVTGSIGDLIYIPEKGKVYGTMGVNGSNERFVGYINIGLQTVVQLGFFPGIGAGRPSPNNGYAYSPVSDSMYGNWASGGNQRLIKFSLTTNTATYFLDALNGASVLWDSNRSLLLMAFGSYYEWDTGTDTMGTTVATGPDFSLRRISFIDPLTNILWGRARDTVTALECLGSINLDDYSWVIGNTDYIYGKPVQFADGSCIAPVTDLAETQSGIRKVCVF